MTVSQQAFFNQGKAAFAEVDPVDEGLGPRFNGDSCAGCHAFPAVGGSSPALNPQIELATKMGARNTIPSFITSDGPIREVRFKSRPDGSADGGVHNLFVISGRTDAPGCNIVQEDFSNRGNLSFRIPTPTFGLGLIEAIPDAVLQRNLRDNGTQKSTLGIRGRFNVNGNDGTVTRFGWKAQNKSLVIFSGEAYIVEQGVSNLVFPQERDEDANCVYTGSFEDRIDDSGAFDDVTLFAGFMRFLAPPERGPVTAAVTDGAAIFNSIGCNLCHTPQMQTGMSSIPALANRPVPLFSDLALHKIGPGLADDISQGIAGGDEFRTAPLWGLGKRLFFLHDGRTTDLRQAIAEHSSAGNARYPASEANGVVQRYIGLSLQQKQNLLSFLRSL